MKIHRIDNSKEQLVLTGLIVSTRFIKDVQPIINLKLFKSDYSRTIAKWCLEYFNENREAPGVHIQDIFNEYSETDKIEPEEAENVSTVLANVSAEFDRADKFNIDYVKGVAETFFSSNHVKDKCKHILDIVDTDPQKAVEEMEKFTALKIPEVEGLSPLNDKRLMKKAFDKRKKPIFRMPGDFGKLVNQDLCRENFIGVLAAEKMGKTWMLLEFGMRASRQRCNVAFFQAGDMTDLQQTARIGIYHSKKSDKAIYCGERLIPVKDCVHNQDDTCTKKIRTSRTGLEFTNRKELFSILGTSHAAKREYFDDMTNDGYVSCTKCVGKRDFKGAIWYKIKEKVTPLTWKEAYNNTQHFYKTRMKGKDFKLHSSAGDLTIDRIESTLDHWERTELFVPDVIITDYADLFVNTANDFRHGTNEIWKEHRFLAQRRNCLVITATQADAEAYGKKKLDLSNFSEDKRKYAHVTAFYAASQTPEEKVMGIMRISQLVVREDDFDSRQEVILLRDLQTGQPLLGSYFI